MRVIRNSTALVGGELTLKRNCTIRMVHDTITGIDSDTSTAPNDEVYDACSLVILPGLINAHTHIGDSVAKEAAQGLSLEEAVDPLRGLKHRILRETPQQTLVASMHATVQDMMRSGITTFADFREGGLEGVELLLQALSSTSINSVILGRPILPSSTSPTRKNPQKLTMELQELFTKCHGLGLSGPNEFTDEELEQLGTIAKKAGKLVAIHAAEASSTVKASRDRFGATEVERALRMLMPDVLVHLTHATRKDLNMIKRAKCKVILCPRANATLGLGFPPIQELVAARIPVALGTDNVMLNAPDLFREMDYTSRTLTSRGISKITPGEILKMVTVNAARVLGLKDRGILAVGAKADLIAINLDSPNLRYSRNIHTTLVQRARVEDVIAVCIDGKFVYGTL